MFINFSLLVVLLSVAIFLIFNKKINYQTKKTGKIFAVLLFLIYLVRLFSPDDAITKVFNIFLVDIQTPIDAIDTWLFSPFMTSFIIILRWLSITSMVFLIMTPFLKIKEMKFFGGFLGTLVAILNIVFFKEHLIAMQKEVNYLTFKAVQYTIENGLFLFFALTVLLESIKNKEKIWPNKKNFHYFIYAFLGGLFFLMPQTILYNFFGNHGVVPKEFNVSHLALIIFPVVLMLTIYYSLRKKPQKYKDALMIFMSIAAVFQYFYIRRLGLPALPLHLCNTAVILLFFGIVFRIDQFFYFAYFANVVGAIAAIILPNYTLDLFSFQVVHFTYNHLYALIIPILGVALHTFPRPKLSHMYKAISVFVVYYIVVVFLNAWFNNYEPVDYFFAYSDFLTDMFNVRKVQFDYITTLDYGGLTFKFYWLFQLIYFFSFIFLMFASWFIYDASYQMVDQHARLRKRQRQIKKDKIRLNKLLAGRKASEPINPEGKDMIKIINFSKRYGHSERYAVKDFSLEVKGGEIYGFLGHNGAGKSTTIKSIVGIQSITEGEIEVCGYSIKSQPLEAKLRIGYVSDNHAVYEKLTGREYIHYVASLYRVPKDKRNTRLNELLDKLALADAIDQMIKSYSHGMRQKLVVIASLIHEPPVWILDEPLTGLDPTSSFQIKEIMKEHARKGNIVFFSSHVIEVVEKICTKIAVITRGVLTGVYNIDVLRDQNISLEELYLDEVNQQVNGEQ